MSDKMLKRAIESMGGIAEFRKGWKRHKKDTEYFDTNRQELLRDYKEEWVAIYNCKVVGHSKHFFKLINKLSEEEKHSVIHLMTTKRMTWILSCDLVGVNP